MAQKSQILFDLDAVIAVGSRGVGRLFNAGYDWLSTCSVKAIADFGLNRLLVLLTGKYLGTRIHALRSQSASL